MNVPFRWLNALPLISLLLAPAASAQQGQGDVVYVPTPQIVVDEMLRMAKISSTDYLIDLGSGDGRIVITAAKKHGASGFGVDLDRYLLKLANEGAKREGVSDRAHFVEQNLFETDLSKATVISSYLLPEMNLKLRPKLLALKPGTRIVAHDYAMGQWDADEEKTLLVPEKKVGDPGKSYVFLWIVPANVAGRWESQIQVGDRNVPYRFDFDQQFQTVRGQVRIGESDGKLPLFKMNGDQISFTVVAQVGNASVTHRFRGTVKGDTIEGTVSVGGDGVGQRVTAWNARQTSRGEMKTGSNGPASVVAAR